MRYVLLLLLLCPLCVAECYRPVDMNRIDHSVVFCSDTFDAPNGIFIIHSDITIDCNSAVIRGDKGKSDNGIIISDVKNVSLHDCNIATFTNGIMLSNVTFSHVFDNNLLKNDVGIRLFDSFENVIIDNNDKSLIKSVSAINSKYNVVSLGNKGVDAGFCDFNSCNGDALPDPCVDGDGYCSPLCPSDCDCSPVVVEPPVKVDSRSADEIIEDIKENIKVAVEPVAPVLIEEHVAAPVLSSHQKIIIYVITFLVALLVLQLYLYKKG